MGRHSGTESALALVVSFMKRDTWAQAELSRELGIGVQALRKRLVELQAVGVPLESQAEHPHVYWSVPKRWIPRGVQLDPEDVADLLRLLARLPNGSARNRVVERVLQGLTHGRPRTSERPHAVLSASVDEMEDRWLSLVEDAAKERRVLAMRYLSTSRGVPEQREVSPHQVTVGPPARFMATCHRDDTLKWFRVDRILRAELGARSDARHASKEALDAAVRATVAGFRGTDAVQELVFYVRDPEARWVQSNLPTPLVGEADRRRGGIRVSAFTGAIVQVARYVVSLGGAAFAETPLLRAAVRELASQSLALHADTAQEVSHDYPVGAIEPSAHRTDGSS